MNKTTWAVARINFKNVRVAYLVPGICVGVMAIEYIVAVILLRFNINIIGPDNSSISFSWYLWLLVVIAAIAVASGNFPKIINLGAKRRDYFWGVAQAYLVFSGVAAAVATLWVYLIDQPLNRWGQFGSQWTAGDVFGWAAHGPLVAFLQQWAFLLLLAAFVHTLAMAQGKWYGWAADVAIIAIISVFTPIAPLRHAEAWFFNMILFHQNALVQIASCLVLAAGIYALSKPILDRRAI